MVRLRVYKCAEFTMLLYFLNVQLLLILIGNLFKIKVRPPVIIPAVRPMMGPVTMTKIRGCMNVMSLKSCWREGLFSRYISKKAACIKALIIPQSRPSSNPVTNSFADCVLAMIREHGMINSNHKKGSFSPLIPKTDNAPIGRPANESNQSIFQFILSLFAAI
jgi:hypothetical protein